MIDWQRREWTCSADMNPPFFLYLEVRKRTIRTQVLLGIDPWKRMG
jgi:hypothetical protein